jgi:hypothetical protein
MLPFVTPRSGVCVCVRSPLSCRSLTRVNSQQQFSMDGLCFASSLTESFVWLRDVFLAYVWCCTPISRSVDYEAKCTFSLLVQCC